MKHQTANPAPEQTETATTKAARHTKVRFDVNQAEAFRHGLECSKPTIVLELNPKDLDQETRNLIADRLVGMDILELHLGADGEREQLPSRRGRGQARIKAKVPTLESLMAAIKENEAKLQAETAQIKKAKSTSAPVESTPSKPQRPTK
jgi:hypothetical protein